MRVLIAPDSFKGSLTAIDAAKHMEKGVLSIFSGAACDLAPIADGGEGTVDALVAATSGNVYTAEVHGPLGSMVEARWGLFGDGRTAVVEMASASGITLVNPAELDPLRASTYGTGEVLKSALHALHSSSLPDGVRPKLIIGIGGSATNDGGAGALQALGARFLDASGRELPPGGAALKDLAAIDLSRLDPLLACTEIRVACDVDTPLLGPRGASAVFGPQKGASAEMVRELDAALGRFADVALRATGKDVAEVAGAGAAGGLGAGLLFFSGAVLEPGVDIVLDATDFSSRAAASDLVLTGEGLSDIQTAYGKAPAGVAKIAKLHGKPVICISGALGPGVEAVYTQGIDAVLGSVNSITVLEYCMENAGELLEKASESVCRVLRIGMALDG